MFIASHSESLVEFDVIGVQVRESHRPMVKMVGFLRNARRQGFEQALAWILNLRRRQTKENAMARIACTRPGKSRPRTMAVRVRAVLAEYSHPFEKRDPPHRVLQNHGL